MAIITHLKTDIVIPSTIVRPIFNSSGTFRRQVLTIHGKFLQTVSTTWFVKFGK